MQLDFNAAGVFGRQGDKRDTMKRINGKSWRMWVCLLAGSLFFSCADEETTGNSKLQAVQCTIGVRGIGDADASAPGELIRSYKIVFVEGEKLASDGTVEQAGTVREIVRTELDNAVASDGFNCQLGPGTYTVYAFGNISDEYFDGLRIVEGGEMPDLSQTLYQTAGNGFTGDLPMSRRQENIVVSGKANQQFSIELIRMLAGIRFVFSNYASQPLAVEEITMQPLTQGDIFLIREPQADKKPSLPVPATTVAYTHVLASSISLPTDPAQKDSVAFYFKESIADGVHPTDRFVLSFKVRRGVAGADDGGKELSEYRYALTDKALAYINRNDFIILPVGLTDYLFSVDVNFYPPIGGYPAAEIARKTATEFYCTFRTAGDFAILPRLRAYADENGWINLEDKTKVKDYTLTLTGDDIFESGKEPRVTETGEILGTLQPGTEGTACVTVTVTLEEDMASTVLSRELTNRIFIVADYD